MVPNPQVDSFVNGAESHITLSTKLFHRQFTYSSWGMSDEDARNYDLQTTMAHEFGHSMGIGDQYLNDRGSSVLDPATNRYILIEPGQNVYTSEVTYPNYTPYPITTFFSATSAVVPVNKQVILGGNCLTETQSNNLSIEGVMDYPGIKGNIGYEDLRRGCWYGNWWGHGGNIMQTAEPSAAKYDLLSQKAVKETIVGYIQKKTGKTIQPSTKPLEKIELAGTNISLITGIRYVNFNSRITGDVNYVKVYANNRLLHVGVIDSLSPTKYLDYSLEEKNGKKIFKFIGSNKRITETGVKLSDLKSGLNKIKIEAYNSNDDPKSNPRL
jgi:hypothetical protein